ncbi:hypothetical protein GGQ80_000786 [Sphingomonas jinjuensis]|uniref:Uncharacterized protein n=1 Tax=Sphingomonas jinjuensis TaxID=535907 RepID=A0A840FFX5_9SPHN|nr:hypothetical protein [Sphingomonas jinjuensis]MBB4152898.1 hypothetical protein [Sphingomonas jinjuensis]
MKSYSDAAMAAIEAGTAICVGAVEILGTPAVRVWGGPWPIAIDGHEYLGVGDRGQAQFYGAGLGAAAQNYTLELSGVDPALLPLLDADEVIDAAVVLRRLIFDGSGTRLLDVHVHRRGRLDQLVTEEEVGGVAVIKAMIEGAARGLRRRGARQRSDADQRLIDPSDGGMKHVSYAGQKMLYWGGKPPATATAALQS